jgi:hypothetical protein
MANRDLFSELELTIVEQQLVHQQEGAELRQQFRNVVDGFRPFKLIKEALHQVSSSGSIKSNILNVALGVSAGYLSKWIIEAGPKNKFKKILGSVVMFGISNLVSKKLGDQQHTE